MIPELLRRQLSELDQSHVLSWWAELAEPQQRLLSDQLSAVDLRQLAVLWKSACREQADDTTSSRIAAANVPRALVRQPTCEAEIELWKNAERIGTELIERGRVAVITVAGGQGTRLGFDQPKGMFPIGPATDRTLFQIFAEQVLARRRRHAASIPWLIMTSDATHAETVRFFEAKQFFGMSPETIWFFRQGNLPALDAASGKMLMDSRSSLSLSPDGHGGLVAALEKAGLLNRLKESGVEHLFYHQVDNPTAIVCDPALIGFHDQHGSELTTNVVRKVSPTERMGVLVDVNGRTEIIEYSELTPEQAAGVNSDGEWIFWAGNTAIHVFALPFLVALTQDGGRLPLHVARKNVPFVNAAGERVQPDDPTRPNGLKFERFIFDALPLAGSTLVVEGNRAREFNPVKNREGADSPETARAALSRIGREWLVSSGIEMSPADVVEISPLQALDADELRRRLQTGQVAPEAILRR